MIQAFGPYLTVTAGKGNCAAHGGCQTRAATSAARWPKPRVDRPHPLYRLPTFRLLSAPKRGGETWLSAHVHVTAAWSFVPAPATRRRRRSINLAVNDTPPKANGAGWGGPSDL